MERGEVGLGEIGEGRHASGDASVFEEGVELVGGLRRYVGICGEGGALSGAAGVVAVAGGAVGLE